MGNNKHGTPRIDLFPRKVSVGAEVGGIIGLADDIGTLGGDEIQAVIASDGCFLWIGGKFGFYSVRCLRVDGEEHAGIVGQSGFQNDGFLPIFQLHHQWGNGKRVFVHAREGNLVVVGFKGVTVTFAGTVVVDVRHEGMVIAVEIEFCNLVLNAERFAQFGNKTIGGSVIVGAELYAVAVPAFQGKLVISLLYACLLIERSGEGGVDGSTGGFGHLHIFSEGESNGLSFGLGALHGNARGQENCGTVVGNRPMKVFPGFDIDD